MKEKKRMYAFHASSVRQLTDSINEMGLQKEDIVQIISSDDGFFLLYYKKVED